MPQFEFINSQPLVEKFLKSLVYIQYAEHLIEILYAFLTSIMIEKFVSIYQYI